MRKPRSKSDARAPRATPATSRRRHGERSQETKGKPGKHRQRLGGDPTFGGWKCPTLTFDDEWFAELRQAVDRPSEHWQQLRAENARFEKILLALFDELRKPGMSDYQLASTAAKEIKRRKAAGDADWISRDEEKPAERERRVMK